MARISKTIALMAVVLGVLACSRSNSESYFPLPQDGAHWEYKLDFMTSLGVQSGKLLVRVDGTKTIGDQKYFKYVAVVSGIPGVEPQVSFYRRSSVGIFTVDGKYQDRPEYLEVPFPVEVGNTWTVNGPEKRTEYHVKAIDTLELYDKKYDECLMIFYTSAQGLTRIQGTQYLAKGIGLVKESGSVDGVKFELTLDNYER